jgi:hypothetical protein
MSAIRHEQRRRPKRRRGSHTGRLDGSPSHSPGPDGYGSLRSGGRLEPRVPRGAAWERRVPHRLRSPESRPIVGVWRAGGIPIRKVGSAADDGDSTLCVAPVAKAAAFGGVVGLQGDQRSPREREASRLSGAGVVLPPTSEARSARSLGDVFGRAALFRPSRRPLPYWCCHCQSCPGLGGDVRPLRLVLGLAAG